ncbi:GNAT family N-acetyltransferase [Winogradskyella sp.]|uniref:GNAT family N-acetyltransferase n=1 Tax=Winogradskyella sp. TaxID=1883156 RepID=UPI00262C0226|nr:GNAT family N-acetyltransferase [Winogradskyella sp.]
MNVRVLEHTESDFLAEMLYEAIYIPEGHDPLPKEIIKDPSLSKYIENWGKDKFDIALVMEIEDQLVGAIWGRLFSKDNKGFGYVDENTPELSMAVLSDYRNQGIGTKLIHTIATEYQKIGVQTLSLSVDKANNASNLYKRLGYKIIEELETSWTMKKELNDHL